MTELAGVGDILDQIPTLEQRPKSVTMPILMNLSPMCCYSSTTHQLDHPGLWGKKIKGKMSSFLSAGV